MDLYDVVVVGGRCAGATLAMDLARRGLATCVVERARFPSEVPSTHLIHPVGVARLQRLGLASALDATGAPPLARGFFALDDARLAFPAPIDAARFGAPWLCIRRVVLDQILIDSAAEAGAEVRTQTAVTGLISEGGRVSGVLTNEGKIRARLVVGADGPSSTVARLVEAGEYLRTEPGRYFVWAYFEGAGPGGDSGGLGRIGDIAYLSMPTDSGLYMAGVGLPVAQRSGAGHDLAGILDRSLARIEHLEGVLSPARRVGPVRSMTRWHGYFRTATGPGWALVGDAGHFKDPTPAQGISDALRQSEALAEVIERGLGAGSIDEHLEQWWRWRDRDAWEMYWLAHDMGSPRQQPVVTQMIRDLSAQADGAERFLRVLNRDLRPSQLFTARRAVKALARAGAARPSELPALVRDLTSIVKETAGRQVSRARDRPPNAPLADQSITYE